MFGSGESMAASGQRRGEGDGILSGKKLAKDIRKQLAEELTQLKDEHPNFQPGLTIVQVRKRLHIKLHGWYTVYLGGLVSHPVSHR